MSLGFVTFRWFDQKSTMTSNSWRSLHAARASVDTPRSNISCQLPSSRCSAVGMLQSRSGKRDRTSSATRSEIRSGWSCRSSHSSRPRRRSSFSEALVAPNVARRSRCTSRSLETKRARAAAEAGTAETMDGSAPEATSAPPAAPALSTVRRGTRVRGTAERLTRCVSAERTAGLEPPIRAQRVARSWAGLLDDDRAPHRRVDRAPIREGAPLVEPATEHVARVEPRVPPGSGAGVVTVAVVDPPDGRASVDRDPVADGTGCRRS